MAYRLRPRLALLNALLLALTTAALAAHFTVELATKATQRLIQEATAHIETLAVRMAALAPHVGPADLEATMLHSAAFPGLRELRWVGPEGQVLAHIRQRGLGPAMALPPGGVLNALARPIAACSGKPMSKRATGSAGMPTVWSSGSP